MDLTTVTVVVVLISIGSTLFAYFRRKYSLNYWQSRNVPCIEPSFLHGNMQDVGKKYHLAFALKKIYDTFKGTGVKYCGSYFWSRPVAILLDLDLMKDVWIKDFGNFTDRGLYYNQKDDPISANLSTVDGEQWKHLRTKLSPAFSSGKMKYIFPTTVKVAESLNEVLREFVSKNGDEVKIGDFVLRYNVDVIGTVAFGIECNSLEYPNSEFIEMCRVASSKPRHSAQFMILITTFPNLARRLGIKLVRDDVSEFFMRTVKETVDYRRMNQIRRNDFMDIVLNSMNDALTVDEIASHVFIFFLGGLDSTSNGMTSCLYELAMNPDVQTKARRIIRESLEKHNGEFQYEMLADLKYIEQVIKESLRKHPLSASINRQTKNDYHVTGTNHIIQKGTWIKIPVFAIHHDPEYYPEPSKFNPDRFESDEYRNRHLMTWIPFGEGPRSCIGLRFALMNLQIALTMLLRDFEILPCDKTPKSIAINPKKTLLFPNEDIILKIRPINL